MDRAFRFRAPLVVAVVVAAMGVGCPKSDPPPPDGAVVFASVQNELNKRLEAVHDVALEGAIVDPAGATMGFRYAMQQPGFTSGELLQADGSRARAFVFDGKTLAIIDDVEKTVSRQNLAQDEEQMLLTLHGIFSLFVCEGWRPPLLKAKGTTATTEGDIVTLTVPVAEGGVKAQLVQLKKDGTFVSKKTLADDGSVLAATTVLSSVVDPGTGLSFPTRWQMQEGASQGTITLQTHVINQGVPAARFSTLTPAGYTERAP